MGVSDSMASSARSRARSRPVTSGERQLMAGWLSHGYNECFIVVEPWLIVVNEWFIVV